MYCLKRFSYSPPVYRMMNLIAAIDQNNHLEREIQHNKDVSVRSTADLEDFNQHILMYCSKRFSYSPPVYCMITLISPVYPVKEKKTYPYLETLKKEILMCHLIDDVGMSGKDVMKKHNPRRISSHLGPLSPNQSHELSYTASKNLGLRSDISRDYAASKNLGLRSDISRGYTASKNLSLRSDISKGYTASKNLGLRSDISKGYTASKNLGLRSDISKGYTASKNLGLRSDISRGANIHET
ncbi:uncharacterized protein LOC128217971 isoform X2 [Mya arenaria]|nr:uncharacterized protein LOC128217971 isoform X2 [Mya arenaria]